MLGELGYTGLQQRPQTLRTLDTATSSERWDMLLNGAPPHRFMPYEGVGIPGTIKLMTEAACGRRGEASPAFKDYVHSKIQHVKAKDYVSEVLAWHHFLCGASHYVRDPVHVEYVQDPTAFIEHGLIGDCDDLAVTEAAGCQVIGNPCRFVTGGFVKTQQPFFSHVWCEVLIQRLGAWIVLDPVAGPMTQAMLDACVWRCNYPIDPDMGRIETIRCR